MDYSVTKVILTVILSELLRLHLTQNDIFTTLNLFCNIVSIPQRSLYYENPVFEPAPEQEFHQG